MIGGENSNSRIKPHIPPIPTLPDLTMTYAPNCSLITDKDVNMQLEMSRALLNPPHPPPKQKANRECMLSDTAVTTLDPYS
mmetsp:Transcript_121060/g.210543  ORF Transcript_121060/g.210543 Transcript_121060/m.210543 type:complete len:81 (+) Transcript_121060:1353-1595(+)